MMNQISYQVKGLCALPLSPQIVTFIVVTQIADQILHNEEQLNSHLRGVAAKFPAQSHARNRSVNAELVFVAPTRSANNIYIE